MAKISNLDAAHLRAEESQWVPPSLHGKFVPAIGSSFIEEFVIGHAPRDVLRELIQNEFDAGGHKLTAAFSADHLYVTGNGKPVDKVGWERLGVILGTGTVIGGEGGAREVSAKENGIGSKNFGLRSLFLFGNRIYVRSAGKMVAMDLPEFGTQFAPDPASRGQRGVLIYVPYRTDRFQRLEPFTLEREETALEDIAGELLHTLAKLTLPGAARSLDYVLVSSERTGRRLVWGQTAEYVPCGLHGVTAVRRRARLTDSRIGRDEGPRRVRLEEIEFQRTVRIPSEHADVTFPTYFRDRGSIRIGISLPLRGRRIDPTQQGRFYYPLDSRDGSTGTTVSVNAPFQMDDHRSAPIDTNWNQWLVSEAVRLTIELLQRDWLERLGGGAYACLRRQFKPNPAWFVDAVEEQLRSSPCWATKARTRGRVVLHKASEIVIPTAEILGSFLSDERYLDTRVAEVTNAKTMAREFGGSDFTINSLVRLRCASSESESLATKLPNDDPGYYFADYKATLSDVEIQVNMASVLTKLSRRLSRQNRKDLAETESTLATDGSLQRAKDLVVVDATLDAVCPVPAAKRLHPKLNQYKVIAALCTPYKVGPWIRQVIQRVDSGSASDDEREALFRYLLDHGATLDRTSLTRVRSSPVVRDHRGDWAAPASLVSRKARHFKALEPVLLAPSRELERCKEFLLRLRIRTKVTGQDLVAFAAHVAKNPKLAVSFEEILNGSLNLLNPKIVDQLRPIAFLRSQLDELASPEALHLRTPINLACLEPEDGFVGEGPMRLYRRLGCPAFPSSTVLLAVLGRWRRQGRGPNRPELFYPVLVATLRRERSSIAMLRHDEIAWVNRNYWAPDQILVGSAIPRCFLSAVPQVPGPEALCKAYESLGAHRSPKHHHWVELFSWFASRYSRENCAPTADERRALIVVYRTLGRHGLPDGVPDSGRFLLSRDGTVHSLKDLRSGAYVQDDYPELAEAIRNHKGCTVAFAHLSDATRPFLLALGLQALTTISGLPNVETGQEQKSPSWFSREHETRLLQKIHQPEFTDALLELGWAFTRLGGKLNLPTRKELGTRLRRLRRVLFVREVLRVYRIAGLDIPVGAEVAPIDDGLAMVPARGLQDLAYLLAYGLSELSGATGVEAARSFALLILPLLQCRDTVEMSRFLRRQGIARTARWAEQEESVGHDIFETSHRDDTSEQVIRHLLGGLETQGRYENGASETRSEYDAKNALTKIAPDTGPQPVDLPAISQVRLTVLQATATWTAPSRGAGGGEGRWNPSGLRDLERDREIGRRGEELIYRYELQRLVDRGCNLPEKLVTWTSKSNETADHDIRSLAEDGKPLWIEVKSTSGTDGRFEWTKNEFEKALREGDHYELWRVYEALTERPTAKCFRNPLKLIAETALRLDIGTLRAVLEPMDVSG